ncbi:MAG: vWA domain-containing protein [Ferruginibacter sp.]
MKLLLKTAAISFFALTLIPVLSFTNSKSYKHKSGASKKITPKIQVAILLDVSGSMEGLIEQAKAQLWNMVSVMGKAQCNNNVTPKIEIALYEYGRTTNSKADGYVKQISGFTGDLDLLSKNLFSLTTNGGDEFCGHVIYTSLKDLQWDVAAENYKVIFIAGNEDFLQGDILYTRACDEAKQKGVIVNTIYCGDSLQGIREHWNLSSECGNGSFTVINQNEKIDDIPTPYDSIIFSLNEKLNGTYIAYGYTGAGMMAMQSNVDQMNYSASKGAALKRATVKSNAKLYKNESWDMVDAEGVDDKFIDKLDKKTLPDSLKRKTNEQLKQIVKEKASQRSNIQKQIVEENTKREYFIATEKAKGAVKNNTATLESEIEKIIKHQAKRYNMVIQ